MNHKTNQTTQIISKTFPIFYPFTDSAYQHLQISSSELDEIQLNKSNIQESKPCKSEGVHWEMTPVEIERYDARDDIKLTFNHNESMRKLSFFIDLSKLEIKTTDTNSKSRNLLCNSSFIASYIRLSQREKQILKQLSLMKTSEEIASLLFISCNTVKNHRKSIKQKLEFTSREEQSRFLYWVRGFVS